MAVVGLSLAFGEPGPSRAPVPEDEMVGHYLDATQAQQDRMRAGSVEMDIDATLPKLQKQGKLHALKNITKLGKITFHVLGFTGDNTVKTEVIARYLKAEIDAAQTGSGTKRAHNTSAPAENMPCRKPRRLTFSMMIFSMPIFSEAFMPSPSPPS